MPAEHGCLYHGLGRAGTRKPFRVNTSVFPYVFPARFAKVPGMHIQSCQHYTCDSQIDQFIQKKKGIAKLTNLLKKKGQPKLTNLLKKKDSQIHQSKAVHHTGIQKLRAQQTGPLNKQTGPLDGSPCFGLGLFSFQKIFIQYLSHRMFGYMHRVLNIVEKNN